MTRQVIALGGGGFAMAGAPALDDYILAVPGRPRPRICFIGTASGDSESFVSRFYRRFETADCEPSHLALFRRTVCDLDAFLAAQDIVYVGGGNVVSLLAVWRAHGVDRALRAAYERGTVLAGLSAGSLCWFEAGVTDSFADPALTPITALGLLAGSHCPHYDGEPTRRPAYRRAIAAGMVAGIGADDCVGLHYVDGSLVRVVSSRPGARAYRVERDDTAADGVRETAIEPMLL